MIETVGAPPRQPTAATAARCLTSQRQHSGPERVEWVDGEPSGTPDVHRKGQGAMYGSALNRYLPVHGRIRVHGALRAIGAAAGCALIATVGILAASHHAGTQYSGPVLSVHAIVEAAPARDPHWLDTPRLVRAIATRCSARLGRGERTPCIDPQPSLIDASNSGVDALPLGWAAPSPWRAFLRRIPLLGTMVTAPQQVRWGTVATYLVRVRPAPCTVGGTLSCYWALLVDAARHQ